MGINYTLAEELILTLRSGYFIQDREESDGEEGVLLDGVLSKTWTFRRGSINAVGSAATNTPISVRKTWVLIGITRGSKSRIWPFPAINR